NKQVPRFPIEGKHTEVSCENCHTRPGSAALVFRGTPTACEGCHKVPKHGDFGACAQCHTTQGFAPQTFSHDKTRFPLAGPHEKVACETCHARFKKGSFAPGPNACAVCHGDPHQGQFTGQPRGAELELPKRAPHARLQPETGAPSGGRRVWGCTDCH